MNAIIPKKGVRRLTMLELSAAKVNWKTITDKSQHKALVQKYSYFADYPVFSAPGNALLYFDGWVRTFYNMRPYEKKQKDEWIENVENRADATIKNGAVKYKETETDVEFTMMGASSRHLEINNTNVDALARAFGFGKSLKLPLQWQKEGDNAVLSQWKNLLTKEVKLEDFLSAFTNPSYDIEEYHPGFYGDNKKQCLEAVRVQVTCDSAFLDNPARYQGTKGTLEGSSWRASLSFQFRLIIKYPWEFVYWAQACKKATDYVPYLALMHVRQMFRSIENVSEKADDEFRLLMGRPAQIQERIKASKATVKPRVNKEGYAILRKSAAIIRVPVATRFEEYEKQLRSLYDREHEIFVPPSKMMTNKVIAADWLHGMLSFTSGSGTVLFYNLRGCTALDNVTIYRFLEAPFIESVDFWNAASKFSGSQLVASLPEQQRPAGMSRDSGNESPLREVLNILGTMQGGRAVTWAQLADPSLIQDPQIQVKLKQLQIFVKDFQKDFAKWAEDQPVPIQLQIPFYFDLLFTYGKADVRRKLSADYQTAVTMHTTKSEARLDKPLEIANMPGFDGALLYQAGVITDIGATNDAVALDAAAGSGKCLTGDTLVLSDRGLMRLDELRQMSGRNLPSKGFKSLKVGVMTSQGLKSTNASFARKGKTHKVILSDGTIFEGLPEHKLWNGSEYIRLDSLKVDDWIPRSMWHDLYGKIVPTFDNDPYNYSGTLTNARQSTLRNFQERGYKLPSKLTLELATIFGYLVAEGTLGNGDEDRRVAFTNHDLVITKHFVRSAKKVFNISLPYNDKGTCIGSLLISRFIRKYCGDETSAHKNIPLCIRQAPKKYQQAFLKALFEGDGCAYDGRIEYQTISNDLAIQVKAMLENMGIVSNLIRHKPYKSNHGNRNGKATLRYVHTIRIHAMEAEQFEEQVGFISTRKKKALAEIIRFFKAMEKNSQNTNQWIFSDVNKIPAEKEMADALEIIDRVGADHYIRVPFGKQFRNVPSGWRSLCYQTGNSNYDTSVRNPTRWGFDKLKDVLAKNPIADFRKELRSNIKLNALLNSIEKKAESVWTRVVSSEPTGKIKDVYDLSVPGPHDYVANGYLSHNTIMYIGGILKRKMKNPNYRVAVITQGNLIPGFVEEINTVCQDKVNALPLSIQVIDRLKESGMDEDKIINWIKKLPPNTIPILSYDSSKSRPETVNYMGETIKQFHIAVMLNQIGFDCIVMDESQNVKNDESARAEALSQVSSDNTTWMLGSGTMIHKDASDLPGQLGMVNQMILGTKKDFLDQASVERTGANVSRWRPDIVDFIQNQMKPYIAVRRVRSQDFGYLLPDLDQMFMSVSPRPRVREYYKDILNKAVEKIMADQRLQKALKAAKPEDKDRIMENAMKRYLEPVEQFINAPGSVEAFTKLTGVTEEDIRPPKMNAINYFCSDYLFGTNLIKNLYPNNPAAAKDAARPKGNNKIIIFCYHLKVGDEIWNYLDPKVKAKAVRYKAGDQDALNSFKNDDEVRIMVSDEKSIQAGHNFQVADAAIRVESLWTPGDLEQASRRVNRPTPPSLNRKVILRDGIDFRWLVCDGTMDVAKTCRLLSRLITNFRISEGETPSFQPVEKELQLINAPILSMSLDTIHMYEDWNQLTNVGFLPAWNKILTWEAKEKEARRIELAKKIEKELGVKVDPRKAPDKAMVPIKQAKDIEGSRRVYVPWINGAKPEDPHNVGWKAMSIVPLQGDTDDEGNELDEEDIVDLPEGTKVFCEYGVGTFRRLVGKRAEIDIPKLGRVKLPRSVVYFAETHPERLEAALKKNDPRYAPPADIPEEMLQSFKKLASDYDATPAKGNGKTATPPPKVSKKVDDEEDEEDDVTENDLVEGMFAEVNRAPCLFVTDWQTNEVKAKLGRLGFRKIDPALYLTAANVQGAQRILSKLMELEEEGKIVMNSKYTEYLEKALELFKQTKGNFRKAKPVNVKRIMQNFYTVDQHRDPSNPKAVRPYVMSIASTFAVVFDLESNTAARKLRNLKIPGVKVYSTMEELMVPLESPATLWRYMNKMRDKGIVFENEKEVLSQAKG